VIREPGYQCFGRKGTASRKQLENTLNFKH
jgi:hypothetical protein